MQQHPTFVPYVYFLTGLLIAAVGVIGTLGGCSIPNSRDQLTPPSQVQRSIEPARPYALGWTVR